jgi:hypothetical protein
VSCAASGAAISRCTACKAGEVSQHRLEPVQQSPRAVERGDRVLEARGLGLAADRVQLGQVQAHCLAQRGREMLGPDRREGRQAEGRGPGLEQRVGGQGGGLVHGQNLR